MTDRQYTDDMETIAVNRHETRLGNQYVGILGKETVMTNNSCRGEAQKGCINLCNKQFSIDMQDFYIPRLTEIGRQEAFYQAYTGAGQDFWAFLNLANGGSRYGRGWRSMASTALSFFGRMCHSDVHHSHLQAGQKKSPQMARNCLHKAALDS